MSALVGQLLQIPLRHEIGLAKSNLSNKSLSLKQYAVYNTMRHCLRLWKMITSAIIQQLCIIIVDDCRLKHQPKDPLKALDVELLYKEAGQNSCCIMLHGITAIFFVFCQNVSVINCRNMMFVLQRNLSGMCVLTDLIRK